MTMSCGLRTIIGAALLLMYISPIVWAFSGNQRVFVSTPVSQYPKRFVSDLMAPPPSFVVGPDDSNEAVMPELLRRGLTVTPVLDHNDCVVGLLQTHDFLPQEAYQGTLFSMEGPSEKIAEYVNTAKKICGQCVGDIMRASPPMVHPTTPMRQAATLLSQYSLQALPVVDAKSNRLLGMITPAHVMRDLLHVANYLPAAGAADADVVEKVEPAMP